MDILPIQGTSVPSEHIFSSSNETLTKRRSRLNAETVEALQVLKYAIKSKGTLVFTSGMSRESELEYIESLNNDYYAVPTDLQAYIGSLRAYERLDEV